MVYELDPSARHVIALLASIPLAFGTSLWLTGVARRYALSHGVIDHPNARSSHTVATPRGGGVAIVVSFLLVVVALGASGKVSRELAWALLGACLVVAILGMVDDQKGLPARWRFLGHLVAALWVWFWLRHVPPVPVFGSLVDLGIAGTLLALFYFTWMVNLFNFMDGIDGIASVEAVAVSLGGAFIWWATQPEGDWILAAALAACVAGFLVWNFPPAKIFMGDAGSGFLGCAIATLALWSSQAATYLFWSWFILVGCFMVDATTTLVRRVYHGERFNEAHRSHAYQYATRLHRSHKVVSLGFAAITVLWLFPIATAVAFRRLDGLTGVTIAYLPLGWLAFRYKAGNRTAQEL